MEASMFAELLGAVRELDAKVRNFLPWWNFHAEPMDYTADPSWYAGPV